MKEQEQKQGIWDLAGMRGAGTLDMPEFFGRIHGDSPLAV